jgi:hypothetical protein
MKYADCETKEWNAKECMSGLIKVNVVLMVGGISDWGGPTCECETPTSLTHPINAILITVSPKPLTAKSSSELGEL